MDPRQLIDQCQCVRQRFKRPGDGAVIAAGYDPLTGMTDDQPGRQLVAMPVDAEDRIGDRTRPWPPSQILHGIDADLAGPGLPVLQIGSLVRLERRKFRRRYGQSRLYSHICRAGTPTARSIRSTGASCNDPAIRVSHVLSLPPRPNPRSLFETPGPASYEVKMQITGQVAREPFSAERCAMRSVTWSYVM